MTAWLGRGCQTDLSRTSKFGVYKSQSFSSLDQIELVYISAVTVLLIPSAVFDVAGPTTPVEAFDAVRRLGLLAQVFKPKHGLHRRMSQASTPATN